jgi:hypothetical protein
MPKGVRLIEWNLKQPPVAIESFAVVTDPDLFARTTLEQLRIALAEPKRWVGWSVPQLIDRLAQVGVLVTLESGEQRDFPKFRKDDSGAAARHTISSRLASSQAIGRT